MKERMSILLAAATLPLAIAACSSQAESTANETAIEEIAVTVGTVTAQATEVVDIAVLSADLLPVRRATLAAEVPGNVEVLTVDIGEPVRRGAVIARIDTRALRQQVAEAEALYRQAQDRFERAERLFAKRSITKEQQIDAAASRDVAEARLASAKLALLKSRITAPWTGRVSARLVEVGDYASPGQPIIEIVATDRLKVRAPASAADVPFLEIGAPIELTVDVLPGEIFTGEIVRLGAELDPDTRTLNVEAEIDNANGRLKPGFFGRIEIPRQVIPNALLIPLVAVVDFENHQIVYVVEAGEARRHTVELGPIIGENVVVTDGIADGDKVIVTGLQQVADGSKVTDRATG